MKPAPSSPAAHDDGTPSSAHSTADQSARAVRALSPALLDELCALFKNRLAPATTVRPHESLAKRTTLRVGGPADLFIEPATEAELAFVLQTCGEQDVPVLILGRGSNLLVRDGGVRGCVISMGHPEFSRITIGEQQLRCGAGARLKAVAVEAKRHGLGGLEFLEGIPGSVGGALRMNAGAMGQSTFQVLQSIRFMNRRGNVQECPADEIPFAYRACPHFETHIALAAVFKGIPTPRPMIESKMAACSRKRWQSQPAAPSAGCIFKNPLTIPAGKLIEELGLKGTQRGGAEISTVHGNFIVNTGSATACDVLELIRIVQEKARSCRGIDLQTEVEIIGEEAAPTE